MSIEFQPEEFPKDSLRAYLQRAEVRLSTMHRIAGTFIGGAGLLVLLPLFLKDALAAIVKVVISDEPRTIYVAPVAVPVAIAFIIPLVAMYLLLRDLILFYFSASLPEPDGNGDKCAFHPRFALTAIPYANDEGYGVKNALRKLQFQPPLCNFLLPHDEREKAWLSKLMSKAEGKGIALPESPWLQGVRQGPDYNRLRLAFGLAGAYDRPLIEEVAKSELSLIRHNLLLRRLVIRYMKALLLFIWTALILFGLVSWLGGLPPRVDTDARLLIITICFLLWSSLAPLWVRAPVRWIYREFDQNLPDKSRDPHLVKFERFVLLSCLLSTFLAGFILVWFGKSGSGWWFGGFGLLINVVALLRSLGYLDRVRII